MLPIIKHAQVMAEMEDGAFNSQALLFSRQEKNNNTMLPIIKHAQAAENKLQQALSGCRHTQALD